MIFKLQEKYVPTLNYKAALSTITIFFLNTADPDVVQTCPKNFALAATSKSELKINK